MKGFFKPATLHVKAKVSKAVQDNIISDQTQLPKTKQRFFYFCSSLLVFLASQANILPLKSRNLLRLSCGILSKLFDMWGSFHPIYFGRKRSVKVGFDKVGIASRNHVIFGGKSYLSLWWHLNSLRDTSTERASLCPGSTTLLCLQPAWMQP